MNVNADNDEHKAFESDEILEDDYDDDADHDDDDANFIDGYTDGLWLTKLKAFFGPGKAIDPSSATKRIKKVKNDILIVSE